MVSIETINDKIEVSSPYNKSFVSAARGLGGRWLPSKMVWSFDARDADHVRAACKDAYGTDGSVEAPLVTLRAVAGEDDVWASRSALCIGPVEVARAFGRDSNVRLADGVSITNGNATAGGSRKNWATVLEGGSVVEIKDVPADVADKAIESAGSDWASVEIVTAEAIDRAVLEAEKARLTARLAEIENLLK